MRPIFKALIFGISANALLALWQVFAEADKMPFVSATTVIFGLFIFGIVAVSMILTLPARWQSAIIAIGILVLVTFITTLAHAKGWYNPNYENSFFQNSRFPRIILTAAAVVQGIFEKVWKN